MTSTTLTSAKHRISKKLLAELPAEVAEAVKRIQDGHPNIKSATVTTVNSDHEWYMGENEEYTKIYGEDSASVETAAEHRMGAANQYNRIGTRFTAPVGGWVLRVNYYDKYYLTIYHVTCDGPKATAAQEASCLEAQSAYNAGSSEITVREDESNADYKGYEYWDGGFNIEAGYYAPAWEGGDAETGPIVYGGGFVGATKADVDAVIAEDEAMFAGMPEMDEAELLWSMRGRLEALIDENIPSQTIHGYTAEDIAGILTGEKAEGRPADAYERLLECDWNPIRINQWVDALRESGFAKYATQLQMDVNILREIEVEIDAE